MEAEAFFRLPCTVTWRFLLYSWRIQKSDVTRLHRYHREKTISFDLNCITFKLNVKMCNKEWKRLKLNESLSIHIHRRWRCLQSDKRMKRTQNYSEGNANGGATTTERKRNRKIEKAYLKYSSGSGLRWMTWMHNIFSIVLTNKWDACLIRSRFTRSIMCDCDLACS